MLESDINTERRTLHIFFLYHKYLEFSEYHHLRQKLKIKKIFQDRSRVSKRSRLHAEKIWTSSTIIIDLMLLRKPDRRRLGLFT